MVRLSKTSVAGDAVIVSPASKFELEVATTDSSVVMISCEIGVTSKSAVVLTTGRSDEVRATPILVSSSVSLTGTMVTLSATGSSVDETTIWLVSGRRVSVSEASVI